MSRSPHVFSRSKSWRPKSPAVSVSQARSQRVLLVGHLPLDGECLAHALEAYCPTISTSLAVKPEGVSEHDPDLALVDLTRSQWNSSERSMALSVLRDELDGVPIILIADLAGDDRALLELVEGCIPGRSSIEATVAAVQFTLAGGRFAPIDLVCDWPRSTDASVEAEPLSLSANGVGQRFRDGFTQRECEIVHLVRAGKQNKVIAHELGISVSTVKVHIRNIMKKSLARNRTQVAMLPMHRALF